MTVFYKDKKTHKYKGEGYINDENLPVKNGSGVSKIPGLLEFNAIWKENTIIKLPEYKDDKVQIEFYDNIFILSIIPPLKFSIYKDFIINNFINPSCKLYLIINDLDGGIMREIKVKLLDYHQISSLEDFVFPTSLTALDLDVESVGSLSPDGSFRGGSQLLYNKFNLDELFDWKYFQEPITFYLNTISINSFNFVDKKNEIHFNRVDFCKDTSNCNNYLKLKELDKINIDFKSLFRNNTFFNKELNELKIDFKNFNINNEKYKVLQYFTNILKCFFVRIEVGPLEIF